MSDSRLNYLFGKYYDKTATVEERAEFMEAVTHLKSDDELFGLMEAAYQSDQSLLMEFTPQIRERILKNVFLADGTENLEPYVKVRKLNFNWISYVAAVLIMLVAAGLFFYKHRSAGDQSFARQTDVAPGGNRAILTLGNGEKIILDDAANGVLAKQGNITVSKRADGQLVYNIGEGHGSVSSINSIETPNGGKYEVNLPDGTKVWLNAGSQLRFPTLFAGNERKVELSGEAYFEVAKNLKKPFKVKMNNNAEVVVLGTHFNINAYDGEADINTTLLEGAVMVRMNKKMEKILPGQQALLNRTNKNISLVDDVNVNQVIAWKNGFFSTEGISLPALMKQVEKWYDVRVIYKDDVQADFKAKLPRDISLAELLNLLELTKQVHFKLDKKTLIVMK